MEEKDHIKNVLKDFYRNGTGSAVETVMTYAPNADKPFVLLAMKEFKEGGFTENSLNVCAESILASKVPEKAEKKPRYQPITEEN